MMKNPAGSVRQVGRLPSSRSHLERGPTMTNNERTSTIAVIEEAS